MDKVIAYYNQTPNSASNNLFYYSGRLVISTTRTFYDLDDVITLKNQLELRNFPSP